MLGCFHYPYDIGSSDRIKQRPDYAVEETMDGIAQKLRQPASWLRQRLYRIAKSCSFALLRKLDPEFGFVPRPSEAATGAPGQSSASASTLPSAEIVSAIVINSDRAIATRDAADFYLRGIFADSGSATLARAQLPAGGVGLSFDEIEDRLARFFINPRELTDDGRIPAMRSAFYAHQAMTALNRRAYATSNRTNPAAVFWPDPTSAHGARSLYTELPFAQAVPLLDRSTKIVSAGSCFAIELAHALQRDRYSYLVKENNNGAPGSYEFLDGGELPSASAAWGIIFNTPSFRQLVEKAFGVRSLPKILWSQEIGGNQRYLDPFRENIAFYSPEAYEANYLQHIEAARDAFLEMDVFVITLGLNEVWYFKADGAVFSRSPWRTAPSLVGHKVLSVEDNVTDLVRMTEILRAHNPRVQIICTLSPVPLHATFRGDEQHIVTANAHSKAILRVAAEEYAKRCPGVFYFPAYEVVTTSTQHPWAGDQRHVSPEAVTNVMALFHRMFDK
jgi:hypothetical protein